MGRTLAAAFAAVTLVAVAAGCAKKEPEPSMPGYYTGPIKPKGEVAPGPASGAKSGVKGEAATGK
jgi:hypothetical protein